MIYRIIFILFHWILPDIRTFHPAYKNMPDIWTLYCKRLPYTINILCQLQKHTGYKNHRLKTVLIYTYMKYVGYTNIFSTPKGILISDIHCIRHAGYKDMMDIRTLYAIPNDVLITSIHFIRFWIHFHKPSFTYFD